MVLNIKNVVDNGVKIIINHEKDQDRTSILQLTDKKAKDFFLNPKLIVRYYYHHILTSAKLSILQKIDYLKQKIYLIYTKMTSN